jgi:hypothetical protein
VRASVDRFIRATAALSVKASIAPQGAPAQGSVRIADSIRRLMLELLQATSGAARLDKGGLAQVKQHLLEAIATRSGKDKPAADSFAARLNLMLPLLLLQLQLPRTQEQAGVSIAKLMVMVHGRSAGPGTGDPPPPYTALPNYDSLPPRYAATEKGRGT